MIDNNQVDLTQIVWKDINPPLKEENMHLLSQLFYPLPKRYIELPKISNGGYPQKDVFDFMINILNITTI